MAECRAGGRLLSFDEQPNVVEMCLDPKELLFGERHVRSGDRRPCRPTGGLGRDDRAASGGGRRFLGCVLSAEDHLDGFDVQQHITRDAGDLLVLARVRRRRGWRVRAVRGSGRWGSGRRFGRRRSGGVGGRSPASRCRSRRPRTGRDARGTPRASRGWLNRCVSAALDEPLVPIAPAVPVDGSGASSSALSVASTFSYDVVPPGADREHRVEVGDELLHQLAGVASELAGRRQLRQLAQCVARIGQVLAGEVLVRAGRGRRSGLRRSGRGDRERRCHEGYRQPRAGVGETVVMRAWVVPPWVRCDSRTSMSNRGAIDRRRKSSTISRHLPDELADETAGAVHQLPGAREPRCTDGPVSWLNDGRENHG